MDPTHWMQQAPRTSTPRKYRWFLEPADVPECENEIFGSLRLEIGRHNYLLIIYKTYQLRELILLSINALFSSAASRAVRTLD